jgi:hypothetical protein
MAMHFVSLRTGLGQSCGGLQNIAVLAVQISDCDAMARMRKSTRCWPCPSDPDASLEKETGQKWDKQDGFWKAETAIATVVTVD